MKKEVITEQAQQAPGLLSQAIISNGMIYTSGFIHMTAGGELVGDTIEQQLKQVMTNIANVLEEAGSDVQKIVKATIYVTNMSKVPELNKFWVKYFHEVLPAREAVEVSALPLGARLEISVIAEAA